MPLLLRAQGKLMDGGGEIVSRIDDIRLSAAEVVMLEIDLVDAALASQPLLRPHTAVHQGRPAT